MILADIALQVARKIGLTDAATLAVLKGFARSRHEAIWRSALWRDTLTIHTRSIPAGAPVYILPHQVAAVVAVRLDDSGLIPVDQAFAFDSLADLWDESGTPTHYTELGVIATRQLPASPGERLSIVSTSSDDTAIKISITGEDADGHELREVLTLAGTSAVLSAHTYAVVYQLSKATSLGSVNVHGHTSGNYLQTLLPDESARQHRRIRLLGAPSRETPALILCKRHPAPLRNDSDDTLLTSCDPGLLALVLGDALEWTQQYAKAASKFSEGNALIESAKIAGLYQSAQAARVVIGHGLGEPHPYDYLTK